MHKLFCFSTDFLQIWLKICVWLRRVQLRRPIFIFYFRRLCTVFLTFYLLITSLFLNQSSSMRAQNSCIAKASALDEAGFQFSRPLSKKIKTIYSFLSQNYSKIRDYSRNCEAFFLFFGQAHSIAGRQPRWRVSFLVLGFSIFV